MLSRTVEQYHDEKIEKIIELAPKLDIESRMRLLTLIHILNPDYITEQADGCRINLDRLPKVQINRIYSMCLKYSRIDKNDLID